MRNFRQNRASLVPSKARARALMNVGVPIKGQADRAASRFLLSNLPPNAILTQVRVRFMVTTAGGAAHLLDIHPYGGNGQDDPCNDTGQTFYNKTAQGTEYYNDGIEMRTVGDHWVTLGGSVCQDVMNAKTAVDRFSLGWHEEGDNDAEGICGSGFAHQLEITYQVPVAWGGSALPQLQMAKAILGL